MTITESPTLAALIERYEHSVAFAESVPNALSVAKAFCEMRWSNGGLVLLGVDFDGRVTGVDRAEIPAIYERFDVLCRELTKLRVEIGTLSMGFHDVVFLVFNPIPRHTKPLESYLPMIHDVVYS